MHYRFNAVVSKSINKHGGHAYSVFGHTRQFGQGVKINHYFPGKDYYYQEPQSENKPVEKETKPKPVQEVEPENKDDNKMILIESGDKMMLLQSLEVVSQNPVEKASPIVKVEPVEGAPVKIVPGVVSMLVKNTNALDSTDMGTDKVDSSTEKIEAKVEEKPEKEDTVSDSDVASSYYHHSRIYYVGF